MSLLWEGLELQPAHGRWRFWVEEGRDELADFRTSSQVIPFRRGRLHQRGFADRRTLELRGYIAEATLAAFRVQADTLKGLLDPEADELGTLVDTFEDGNLRWIRAVARNVISRYGGEGRRLMSIELEALDPYWYGAWGVPTLDDGGLLDDGGFLDDSADVIVVPTSTAHSITIDTEGTARVERIRVTFTGASISGPGLEIPGVSPVGFQMSSPLGAAAVLVVDNAQRTVLRAGSSARDEMTLFAGNSHGEYISLAPGVNTVRILGQPAEARIQFLPTYQ